MDPVRNSPGIFGKIKNLLKVVFGITNQGSAGGILLPDGTTAAPALAFSSESNMGLTRTSSGILGFYVGNARVLDIRTGANMFLPNNAALILLGTSGDAGISYVVANVIKTVGSTGAAGWLQNTAGRARNTADVANATATMANLSDETVTLKAGRKYSFIRTVFAKNSVAADGIQFDWNGGTATMTSFRACIHQIAGANATKGTDISTSLAGVLNYTAMGDTNDAAFLMVVTLVCNAGGTLILRFAENTHSSGIATVQLGSFVFAEDMP